VVDRSQPVYTFLPWVREGFAAFVSRTAMRTPITDGRLGVRIRLRINQGAAELDVPVKLHGPGDVTGIDPREIVRTDPVHLTADFEPIYFPTIEFDRPDFPWLFTPAAPDASQRLRPWLCLVVVPKVAGVSLRQAEPLPLLTCPRRELPDLEGSWAWAHAQVAWTHNPKLQDANGQVLPPRRQIEFVMANNPERTVSRIVSLRPLKPNEGYYACLVPTYAAGLKAGLGQEVTAADEAALLPAWSTTTGNPSDEMLLPVYYHWEFATGLSNSFEALLRRLRPNPIPSSAGRVRLDLRDPGWGITPLASTDPGASVWLQGVLSVENGGTDAATSGEPPARIQTDLLKVLGGSMSADGDPLVRPPIYGAQHAGERTVPSNGTHPWVRELNLDPRHRVAGGLGTLVVRYQQELLMASAWEQSAAAKAARQQAAQEGLANHMRSTLCERLTQFAPERLAQLTEPLHANVAVGASTVQSTVHESSLPDEALSPAFRRLTRARGPLARRIAAGGDGDRESETLTLVRRMADEPVTGPPETLALRALRVSGGMIAPPERARSALPTDGSAPTAPLTSATSATPTAPIAVGTIGSPLASAPLAAPVGTVATATPPQATAVVQPLATSTLTAAMVAEVPRPFLAALLQPMLVAELTPLTVASAPIAVAMSVVQETVATTAEEKAMPSFPQPMYELLRDYFPELFFPGLEHVPPNTVALLKTNQPFIEAYMVGLNHEMSRELLWREFVTDYRATYFRRFWDVPGSLAPEFPPIREWTRNLGANRIVPSGIRGNLVLLIRGDLLRRFPAATIYASRAKLTNGKAAFDTMASPMQPIFRGTKAPDVTFLGFPIDETAARGSATDPGYFFVIQEQPTEPRFGWEDEDSATTVVDNAAILANRTLQRPFRVAIHAAAILPDSSNVSAPDA
jgi:hypothetical protein